MPTHRNNRIVIDIKRVAYAWFFYRNQYGNCRPLDPGYSTKEGQEFNGEDYAYPLDNRYPCETLTERAKRLALLDIWMPVVRMRMSAADVLEFTGPKAVSLWEAWKAKQFKKDK